MKTPRTSSLDEKKTIIHFASIFLCLVILCLVLWQAWFCDDSFFTIRSSLNLRYGYGPVWNPGERVQSFTNPLWMLLLSLSPAGIIFDWTIFLSTFLVSGTLVMLLWSGRQSLQSLIALIFLLSSWVFIDYSTSGLETSLSGFLVALSSVSIIKAPRSGPNICFRLGLIAGLSYLSRPDLVLITFLDPLFYILLNRDSIISKLRSRVLSLFAGSALVVLSWMFFSIIYYGFPFPVTAYAKLAQNIERFSILKHGIGYTLTFLISDLSGSVLIALACFLSLRALTKRSKGLSIAPLRYSIVIVSFSLYIIYVGGDFMIGRFYYPLIIYSSFAVSSIGLPSAPWLRGCRRRPWVYVALIILISAPFVNGKMSSVWPFTIGGASPSYPLTPFYRSVVTSGPKAWCFAGACDEKSIYKSAFYYLGSPSLDRTQDVVFGLYESSGDLINAIDSLATGHGGLVAGPHQVKYDDQGLTDQLQARMPVIRGTSWRPAHFTKFLPRAHDLESLTSSDRDLRQAVESLELITKGPMLSPSRLRTIIAYNSGGFRSLYERISSRYGEPNRANCELSNRAELCLSELPL